MFGLGLKQKWNDLQNDVRFALKNKISKPRLFNLKTAERIGVIYHHPSDMCETDRVMLYALVRGLRPKYALEIGARWGGSAKIIANAMQENNTGNLVGIDPETDTFRAKSSDLHDRYKLVKGYSPQIIPDAVKSLGSKTVDFVFIDALHTHDAVQDDFNGVLPFLAPNAHILFHDAYHQGIDKAISQVISENKNLFDLGFLTRNPEIGETVSYQGLRLVRAGEVDSHQLIEEAYDHSNLQKPIFDDALRNYDEFANRIGKGATPEEIETINRLKKR